MGTRIIAVEPSVTLLHSTPEQLIVHAGRQSYQSHEKADQWSDERLLKHFMAKREGPLKFGFAMMDVTCSYATHAHYVRHTFLAQNWLSQRYTESLGVSVPEGLNEEQRKVYLGVMQQAQHGFELLREMGATKQDARYVQGQGVIVTGSIAGSPMTFADLLDKRLPKRVMPETRKIAGLIRVRLSEAWPTLFGKAE